MIVGYARTSTVEQIAGFESQLVELKKAGCEKVYQEQVSSVGNRVQLDAAMEFVREHDTLTVTKLDRLARSTKDLMSIIQELDRKNVVAYFKFRDRHTNTDRQVDADDTRWYCSV